MASYGVGQNYGNWPADGKYRGVEIPKRLKQHWNTMSGRWWKQGVDDTLGPEPEENEEKSLPEFGEF
jgi:hypothetical protein